MAEVHGNRTYKKINAQEYNNLWHTKKDWGTIGDTVKKKRKKQVQNALRKQIEKQVGKRINFIGFSPIEDLEEMILMGKIEKVPGTDDLYRMKKP